MFIKITVIFSYISCIQSLLEDNSNLRADCYRSFTDPVVFIKLLHYYPSGPIAIRVVFSYMHKSLIKLTQENVVGKYEFSRYDLPCNTSTFFTTGGYIFEIMKVNIQIYLLSEAYRLAEIKYIFEGDFECGEHQLLDFNQNFAIQLKIKDTGKEYLATQRKLVEIFQLYIQSISDTKGELCIVTPNNRATMVKLKEGSILPGGYISILTAQYNQETFGLNNVKYPAFLCKTHENYNEEKVIFITAKNTISIHFDITYLKSYINNRPVFGNMEIEFDHPNFESFEKLKNIPYIYNKIFISPYYHRISKICSDGSQVMVYYLEYEIEFFATVIKNAEITTDITAHIGSPTSLSDPCGEEEEIK